MNKNILMPGDPGFAGPQSVPETPKLPDEILEEAFTEVVGDVKAALETKPEEAADPDLGPKGSFGFHRPAQQKSIKIPIGKTVDATLLEDLPRSWERKCMVGGFDYVRVEGQKFKTRVPRSGFKTGDHITLTEMIFFPGVGAMYAFSEGSRGSYCVRPDQVSFQMPVAEAPVLVPPPEEILPAE